MEGGMNMTKRGSESKDGVEILRWRIEMPELPVYETVIAFFETIASSVSDFCQGALKARASEAYEHSTDPKKRFRHPPLVYECVAEPAEEGADFLSIKLTVSLRQGGKDLCRRSFGLVFDRSDQTLLSPREAARKRGVRCLPLSLWRDKGGVLLRDGSVWVRKGEEWAPFLAEKTKKY